MGKHARRVYLPHVEEETANNILFLKDLKKNYKSINTLEALSRLGNKEPVYIVYHSYNKHELMKITIDEERRLDADGKEYFSYNVCYHHNFSDKIPPEYLHSALPDLFKEFMARQFFAKL